MNDSPQDERDQRPTIVTIGESYGRKAPNFTIENARFFGRPNFRGELDRFKDERRKFTIIIPEEAVEPLRMVGYNVKNTVPTPEEIAMGREPVNHLKVFMNFKIPDDKKGRPDELDYEIGPDIFLLQGEDNEKLTSKTAGVVDKSRFENIDMEIRGWEYDPEDSAGQFSARLVTFVGVMRPNLFDSKYGRLR